MNVDDIKEDINKTKMRGKEMRFADGKTYVVPTMPLGLSADHPIKKLGKAAAAGELSEEEHIIEFVVEILRINYPDIKPGDFEIDIEDFLAIVNQFSGDDLRKN